MCSSSGRLYCTGVQISMFIIRKTILYRGADKYVHNQEDYIVQGAVKYVHHQEDYIVQGADKCVHHQEDYIVQGC